jgi:(1->4)-alpha-D-glucan 1-alpha-D-glucosylmutase
MSTTLPIETLPEPAAAADAHAEADALFEEEARALAESPPRRPGATYRLQLHKGFRFDDATAAADYLADLGITDLYLSPHLDARPGSTHGYDVFDHARINPEIGDEAAHARLVAKLAERGMGRVLDIVPNHMGVAGRNRYWLDMLENGPQAPAARFFDVDWHPVKEELEGRVLLPILEDQYGKVLESGLFALEREGGSFFIRYRDFRLPLYPRSYATVLGARLGELPPAREDAPGDQVREYLSIWDSARDLPEQEVEEPEQVARKLREKEVIKRRIDRLCAESPRLRDFLDGNIALFRGTPGDPRSFDRMHALLEEQVYRLAYWRVAAEEINYRRFFDINELAGLRTEDPEVFRAIHVLIFRWIARGGVTGLRIDHPDGLADPLGYFRDLQETIFLDACRRRLEARGQGTRWPELAERVRARFREAVEAEPSSAVARYFPVVVEKILSRGEDLPTSWPVDGTVGYGYLNALNGLFVDPAAAEAIDTAYAEFTGDREPFADVLYRAKSLICRASLASEVNMLARQLNRVSEHDRRSRDFTLNDLRKALIEAIACFPVYRTYLRPGQPVVPRDRDYIEQAVARARRRNPTVDATVFTFLQEALLMQHPEGETDEARRMRDAFAVRFQQTTGPVQAKGLEDTSFYRQVKLAALNEVGGDPTRFGTSPSAFHAVNAYRLNQWPGSLGTTATHDTKRGEDTRLRIDAITELVDEWRTRLVRWSRWNARKKARINDADAPDAREEYLFYQVLLGAWPFEAGEDSLPEGFVERLQQYMNKAIREAKVHTSWTDTDPTYGDAVAKFVGEVLAGPDAGPFLKDFAPFARRVARVGVVHSLSQTLIKLASPGVPDIYQGCELWDLSLVDPDNRRPVDYGLRRRLLDQVRGRLAAGTPRAELARDLFAAPEDGAIKLYLTWTALGHRRDHPALYAQGNYRPLEADGDRKAHLVAFARHREGRSVVAVAPRLVAGLMGDDAATPPIGRATWGETRLLAPDIAAIPRRWRDLLTDSIVEVEDVDGRPTLAVADVLRVLPVALLVDEAS